MSETPDSSLVFSHAPSADALPPGVTVDSLSQFLHEVMKPYHDTVPDVKRGVEYALSDAPGQGGFIDLVTREDRLLGAVVILSTGMSGYVPENLLLFVAVLPELRGQGIGGELIRRALARCEGAVKLHVEPENPARRLYERIGFSSKYVEMRYVKP